MFNSEKFQSISYSIHEMNDDLLKEIESFEKFAARFDHTESGVSCVLFSIYNKVAADLGIKSDQKDTSLWKLLAWKEQKVQIKQKSTVKNFQATHQSRAVIPIIKPLSSETKQNWLAAHADKKRSFFTKEQLTPEEQKEKYQVLDQIHYTTSRFLKNELTEEQFYATNRGVSDDQVWKFVEEVAKAKLSFLGEYVHRVPSSPKDGVLRPFGNT